MPTRIEGQCTYALRLLVVSSPSSASNCSDHSFQAWGYSAVVAWVAVVGAEEGGAGAPLFPAAGLVGGGGCESVGGGGGGGFGIAKCKQSS